MIKQAPEVPVVGFYQLVQAHVQAVEGGLVRR